MNHVPTDPRDSPLKRLTSFLIIAWLLLFWSLFFTAPLPNASNAQQTIDRLDVIGLLPEIYSSLLSPEADPASSSSWFNLTERIDVFGIALIVVCGAWATGRLLLRRIGLFFDLDPLERFAFAGGVGLSAVSLGTLALGLSGWLSRPLFWCLLIILILVELWNTVRHIPHSQQPETHESDAVWSENPAPRWLKSGIICICLPFCWCMLLGAMLPPTDFDVKEYHLGGPKEYFLAGRVQFLPHDVYTSFPFLTEMLSLLGMVLRGDWERGAYVGQTVLMFFALLTAVGAFCAARRIAGSLAGWLAALAYLTTPWTYRISIIAYTEGALCAYVVLSLLAFQIWQQSVERSSPEHQTVRKSAWRELLLLGFLAGSAVATKYPGMILVAIPFAVAIMIQTLQRSPTGWRSLAGNVWIYGVGVLVAFGPWMLKNLFETGNPVYPLLYGVFGGVDWSPALHEKWRHAHPAMLLAGSWNDFAGVIYKNDWQSPLLFGCAPLILAGKPRKGIWMVVIYAAVLLAAWFLFTHRIDRFWVPMNSIMAVLAGCGLAAILKIDPVRSMLHSSKAKKSSRQAQTPSSGTPLFPITRWVVLAMASMTVMYNFGYITTPLCGYNAYLSSYAAAQTQTRTQSVAIVDWLKLPPSSKVLFVGEAELFDAHFQYAYNTVFDHSLLEDWTATQIAPGQWKLKAREEILQKLKQEGITHLFVNWNEILRYRTTYGYTDFVSPQRIQQLVDLPVMTPVSLPDQMTLRRWEGIDHSWQAQIEKWGPELKRTLHNSPFMLQYQCFQVFPL